MSTITFRTIAEARDAVDAYNAKVGREAYTFRVEAFGVSAVPTGK